MYTEKVIDHFLNPRNVGTIAEPEASGTAKGAVDGDVTQVTMRIENGIINDVRFKTQGCVAAIACSSMATEMVRGLSVGDAVQKVTKETVAEALGGIPEYKMACSNLAPEAIRKALKAYNAARQF
ncbi:MAG: iron-sulfur cluster assembly scaffold protein [Acidobacteria bacterium]|nr:iron-sulfur cluster assembly scaffold protein [Acidobacteriota bacterium]